MDDFLTGLPVVGGIFDDSDEMALDQFRKSQRIWEELGLPEYSDYVPEMYEYQGDYRPEEAEATLVEQDPAIISRQLAALDQLSGLADSGLSQVDELGFAEARELGSQMARSGREAAIQDAQARGVSGGGLEFALREIANQKGSNRAAQAAREQAAKSAEMRALYQSAYGDALAGFRNQGFNENATNADILNRFNQFNTQYRNDAQLRNLDVQQAVGNANVDQRNYAQQYANDLQDRRFQNRVTKAEGMTGANTGMAQGYAAQNAARTANRNANTQLVASAAMGGAGGVSPQKAKTLAGQSYLNTGTIA